MKDQITQIPKIKASYNRSPPAVAHWGAIKLGNIPLLLAVTDKGAICRLAFPKGQSAKSITATWKKAWPDTEFIHDQDNIIRFADDIQEGHDVAVHMTGTKFQCEVWKNLLKIPHGEVVTYAELARRSKNPKAVRAAGTACGANPVAILVPCHRVIASNGGLGGFGGGLPTKKKLLVAEGYENSAMKLKG